MSWNSRTKLVCERRFFCYEHTLGDPLAAGAVPRSAFSFVVRRRQSSWQRIVLMHNGEDDNVAECDRDDYRTLAASAWRAQYAAKNIVVVPRALQKIRDILCNSACVVWAILACVRHSVLVTAVCSACSHGRGSNRNSPGWPTHVVQLFVAEARALYRYV